MKLLILLVATLLLSPVSEARTAVYPTCSWDKPGVDPYMGDVPSAVDDYLDIPKPVRERLKQRMRNRDYEDIVKIKRDLIVGKAEYETEITDMHFSATTKPKMCRTVSRAKWKDTDYQRGLVYCEDHYCILIPTICRNVSRIKEKLPPVVDVPNGEPGSLMDPRPFIPPPSQIFDPFPHIPVPPLDPKYSTPSPYYPGPYGWGTPRDNNPGTLPPTEVDEPSSILLFLLGAIIIPVTRRCKRQTKT